MTEHNLPDGLYGVIETSKGEIIIELEYQKVPLTVVNFVALVEGNMRTEDRKGLPFYDGLTFHRVEEDFIIQTGDPTAKGTGGPGYSFFDEFLPELRFDKKGIVGMANTGPNTNGSQFFITLDATEDLNDRHTVFGHVVKGIMVISKIRKGDLVKKISILRIGSDAEGFEASYITFGKLMDLYDLKKTEYIKKHNDLVLEKINYNWPDAIRGKKGIRYIIMSEGTGPAPQSDSSVTMKYNGSYVDGRVFIDWNDHGTPITFKVSSGVIPEALIWVLLEMKQGERRIIIHPPISDGDNYKPEDLFPINSWLVYDIELIDVK